MQYYGGENNCTNRMRYAQKVRLALALLGNAQKIYSFKETGD